MSLAEVTPSEHSGSSIVHPVSLRHPFTKQLNCYAFESSSSIAASYSPTVIVTMVTPRFGFPLGF